MNELPQASVVSPGQRTEGIRRMGVLGLSGLSRTRTRQTACVLGLFTWSLHLILTCWVNSKNP